MPFRRPFFRSRARLEGQVVFGCVIETQGPYMDQAARLLLSLRWFGGAQADAPFFLAVVGHLSDCQADFFIRHGAKIVGVSRFDERHGPSNKLRFFELSDLDDYGHIVLLDCDTIIVQDPSCWVQCRDFAAKPADLPTVSVNALSQYLKSHGIPVPEPDYCHDVAEVAGLPYFNSGVIVLGRSWRKKFIAAWKHFDIDLIKNSSKFDIPPYHVDQASLTAAVLSQSIPIQVLPTAMNFPAHFSVNRYPDRVWSIDPIVIHYHGLSDKNGYVKPLPCPGARLRAQMFNARLRAERGCPITNKPAAPKHDKKVIVATGWWSSEEKSQWSIGSDAIRSAAFFDTWYRQVSKCMAPAKIIVTDSHAPIKPDWTSYPNVEWVELDRNYGHPNDLRIGKIKTKFSGYTRSVVNGAMYAFCCDADYFVYVEQDCLVRGEDFLAHAIGDSEHDFWLGAKTEGGVGIEGRAAASMYQNSLIIVARSGLARFISGLLSSPQGDGELSIEVIMERQCSPFGIVAVPYGRSRPIDFGRSHFYAQHLTKDELSLFLDSEQPKDQNNQLKTGPAFDLYQVGLADKLMNPC